MIHIVVMIVIEIIVSSNSAELLVLEFVNMAYVYVYRHDEGGVYRSSTLDTANHVTGRVIPL